MKKSPQRHVAREGHIPAEQFSVQTADGTPVDAGEAIFPLIKEDFDGRMELVGTAFFINHMGIFVTAKHVLMDIFEHERGGAQKANLFGLHFYENNHYMSRAVTTFSIHDGADVAVGRLHPAIHKVTKEPLTNKAVSLSLAPLAQGDKISTYAYPNCVLQPGADGSPTLIHLWPMFYGGDVVEYYPNGRDRVLLPNPCYQTSMTIHGGASGGPVFNKEGKVCALNSTGYPDMLDVSFISRIVEVFQLKVDGICLKDGDSPRAYTVWELIEMGQVKLS